MSTVVKEFEYTGTLQIANLPIGVASIDIYLWGGAGGSGGADQSGEGADGAAGHYVQATNINVSAYGGKKIICVAVGGAGAAGNRGQAASGGTNGKSMSGYSGGVGGPSGGSGTSGSGGGGGGATLVTLYEDGQLIDNIKLGIAGGGAGSGGSGYQSRGGPGINTNTAVAGSPSTLGENGAGHSGDGGGGGAGGGGTAGGKGGSGATGDAGGHAGKSGSNTIPGTGSGTGLATASLESNGSGKVPGKTTLTLSGSQYGTFNGVQLYTNSRAYGGVKTLSGKDGKAIVVFNIPAEARTKVSGTWKSISKIYEKTSGVWKRYIGGYVKVGGVWKAMFSSDIQFTSVATGFGDISGLATSGTEGSGGVVTAISIPVNAPVTQGGNDHDPPPPKKTPTYSWHPNQQYGGYDTIGAANPGKNSAAPGGTGNPRVICTWLYSKGLFDLEDYKIDVNYSIDNISFETKLGYWLWAINIVESLEKRYQRNNWLDRLIIGFFKVGTQARADQIKKDTGISKKGSILGKFLRVVMEPVCTILGYVFKSYVIRKHSDRIKMWEEQEKGETI